MNFLRENLFMVLLTTGTLALCLVFVLWSGAISDQIDGEEVASRQSLSNTIQNLGRPPYSNGNTIMAEKTRVEGIMDSLRKVGEKNIAWNSRNFRVDPLTMLDGSKRPAFPFDANVWEKNQLASRFVGLYHEQLAALLASLNPTGLPTPAEIAEEAEYQEKIIQRRERIRLKSEKETAAGKTPAKTTTPARGVVPGMTPEVMDPEMGMMPPVPGRTPAAGKSGSFSAEANDRAQDILRVRKAQQGAIYVDDSPFHLVFAKGVLLSKAEPEKLWDAQQGLWVQSDIVAAINDTIQTAQDQQKIPAGQRSVITSPIKRLMNVTVGKSDSAAKKKTVEQNIYGGMGGYPGGGQWGPSPEDMPMPPGARNVPTPTRSGGYSRASTPAAPGEKPNTLTQNSANKVFDVVDYSFTVLMPTRYLPLLQESLLKRNYHVILNMQIEPPDGETAVSKNAAGGAEGLYYYGVEPLRKVTISGQLLLVAGFTRGLWDDENKQWLREPLMPLEVMKSLETAALRPEDQQLIDGRLPQPWNPAAAVVTPTPAGGMTPQPRGAMPGQRKIVMPNYRR